MKKPLDINARGFFIYTYQSKKNCLVIIALHQGWNPFQVHQVSTHGACGVRCLDVKSTEVNTKKGLKTRHF